MNKYIKISTLTILLILLASSCIKEIQPQGGTVTGEQASRAPGAFQNFVSGITSSFAGQYLYNGNPYDFGYPSFYIMRDVMTQDIAVEDSSSEWFTSWYGCGTGLGPTYAVAQIPWTIFYGWIKSSNEVIKLAGETPTEGEMIHGAGIAYAMRAMFYMDLARMFATKSYAMDKEAITVPLILENTTTEQLVSNPRATNEVMWQQIISDLGKAETYLEGYERPNKYTPDKSVVYGLKARAYLTMEDWANAEKYAKMAQSGYTPMNEESYRSQATGFNTPNDSWLMGCTFREQDPAITVNDGDSSWGSQMIIEVSESGCGYGANYGAPKRIDYHLYQTIPSTDFRKLCFVDFAIDGLESDEEKVNALSVYSTSPKGLLKTGGSSKSKVVGGLSVKFRPKNGEHANQYKAWTVAVPMMRVEEMMLIEAEAAGMQDESRGIALLSTFGKLRDPNYTYGTHSSENYGSNYATTFQNEVWWQRRVELWAEGFAMWDVKRLDKGVIRSYPNTNHPKGYRWNFGGYGSNNGNTYPNWMDYTIVDTEARYNTALVNNPTPLKPENDSPEYVF